MLISTQGIVLKQRKIANNRRMIVIFTKEYGKISAGTSMNEKSRGKSALALRPFTYAEYDIFKNRGYYNINGAQIRKSYYSIGDDLDRFMVASKLIEYLNLILEEGQQRVSLFDLTLEFLDTITAASTNFRTILYAYIVKTLRMQGVMPEIKSCVNCSKSYDSIKQECGMARYFSVTAGGIICEDCVEREKSIADSLIFEPKFDIVEVLNYFVNQDLSTFAKVTLKPEIEGDLRKILSEYLKYYLDIDILNDELSI